MSDSLKLVIDGRHIAATRDQTIIDAADAAGIDIPRLCHKPGLEPFGGCRVCSVKANGRMVSACTHPVSPGMIVQSDTPEINEHRRRLLEMLFVEGNHFCMSCEKSGHCELQALGYRFGITAPRYEFQFPIREIDASHPDILIDRNRCILCARCVRASRDLDGKSVFGFVGRGHHKKIGVSSGARLRDTDADARDQAVDVCPVGALLVKRVGFAVPIGLRPYDTRPIGASEESGTGGHE